MLSARNISLYAYGHTVRVWYTKLYHTRINLASQTTFSSFILGREEKGLVYSPLSRPSANRRSRDYTRMVHTIRVLYVPYIRVYGIKYAYGTEQLRYN